MRHLQLFTWIIVSVLLSTSQTLRAEDATIIDIPTAANGMVSTQEATATMVGVEILKQGGLAAGATGVAG
ncbi:MAG: gamma-glutamyltransferase, partial [Gammaproteobacteria bacterium]